MATNAATMTLGRFTSDRAALSGERIAILDRGVSVTYAELEARASLLARQLKDAGYRRGSRIATVTGNTADQVVVFFACAKVGIALAPLSWRLRAAELAAQIRLIGPDLVLVEDEFRVLAAAALETAGFAKPLALLGASGIEREVPVRLGSPAPVSSAVVDDDTLLILCTSGTTGEPKAVPLTHAACWWTNLSLSKRAPLTQDDVVLQVLPQHHVAGWNVQPLMAWWHGATVVLERTFDAGRALSLIEVHSVTATMGVPTTYRMMAQHPDFAIRDLTSLGVAVVGGAGIDDDTRAAWTRRGVTLQQGYGLTEAGPNVLAVAAGDDAPIGTAGRAYPHIDVALRDETGAFVTGPGTGELIVRGPAVFTGYLGSESSPVDADGWLATGDVAARDAAGWYFIVGRTSDLIRSGAETISPTEVEGALCAVTGVSDAVVAGAPDADWGEVVVAWVVAESTVSDAQILEGVRAKLAAFKVPKVLKRVPDVPRTALGKPMRAALVADFVKGVTT